MRWRIVAATTALAATARNLLAVICAICALGMSSALAADGGYASPKGKARVAAYYSSFLVAVTANATPSPCPIEGIDLQALGRLNKWIEQRASNNIQEVYRAEINDARRLLAGNDPVFGNAAIRREICSNLRWEANKYDLFPVAD